MSILRGCDILGQANRQACRAPPIALMKATHHARADARSSTASSLRRASARGAIVPVLDGARPRSPLPLAVQLERARRLGHDPWKLTPRGPGVTLPALDPRTDARQPPRSGVPHTMVQRSIRVKEYSGKEVIKTYDAAGAYDLIRGFFSYQHAEEYRFGDRVKEILEGMSASDSQFASVGDLWKAIQLALRKTTLLSQSYTVTYPKKLKKKKDAQLYRGLHELSTSNADKVTLAIRNTVAVAIQEGGAKVNAREINGYLSEIVKNAFDSVNTVKTINPDLPAIEIGLTVTLESGFLVISLEDNGKGLPGLDRYGRVPSDEFFESKKKIGSSQIESEKVKEKQLGRSYFLGGMGSGLLEAKKGIESMKGQLWVENKATGGATIHIKLPR